MGNMESPAIVLDEDCVFSRDLSKSLMGRVKEFASLTNLKTVLLNEGFVDLNVRYLGELWVILEFSSTKTKEAFHDNVGVSSWFSEIRQASLDIKPDGRIVWVEVEDVPMKLWSMNTFIRIATKWGDLIDVDDIDDNCFHSKRLCLYTKSLSNIYENFKIVFRGKVFWTRAKEVPGWIPDLVEDAEDEEQSVDGSLEGDNKNIEVDNSGENSDTVEVAETVFDEASGKNGDISEDPFGLYSILNKKTKGMKKKENDENPSPKFPPGFTPNNEKNDSSDMGEKFVNGNADEELNGVDGVSNNANSKNGTDLIIIEVYAPHDQRDKRMLWDYLVHVVNQWHGEVVIMGDFNEVRFKSDRFGLIFNAHGADVFNSFIDNAGLEEVHLGDGFNAFVRFQHWLESNGIRNLAGKLRFLKTNIRKWIKDNKCEKKVSFEKLKEELRLVDEVIDKGSGTEEDARKRMKVMNSLRNIDQIHIMDLAQKAKVKWSIEGDENLSFFHGMLNKKCNQMNIRGIMVDGVWNEQPNDVKREFLNHYQNRFAKSVDGLASIDMCSSKSISEEQCVDLEREVTKEEIKSVVWDCGIDKSPGPGGFTFGFYRQFLSVIKHDVYVAVKHFFNHGDIPSRCNSSFIALILKVPDANLVKDFRPISLVGSIYKIIAKILTNRLVTVLGDIVDEVQSAFIVGRQMLDGSFILNEMTFYRSLALGINGAIGFNVVLHLEGVLFLLMEVLQMNFNSIKRVVDAGLFKGITLDQSLCLSHMFYADDAVFVWKWSDGNISTLIHVLDCFYHASGLRINLSKSKIMGVNVEVSYVNHAATELGCLVLNSPFSYLGTKMGGVMSHVNAWKELVEKVKTQLSKWKMKTLSIGGRLKLLKSMLGSIPIFHMSIFKVPSRVLQTLESIRGHFFNGHELGSNKASWVKWNNVLMDKKHGGLGVSSLYALNRGLMIKWVWKIFNQKDSVWAKVITAIHGANGKVNLGWEAPGRSCWLSTMNEVRALQIKGVYIFDFLKHKMPNGELTKFWSDTWYEGGILKDLFPRLFALENRKEVTNLESTGEFSVASIRRKIDELRLSNIGEATRWVKCVPIKVNVLAWKIRSEALPTRFNISRRGIDIQAISCPICDYAIESSEHLFFRCSMIQDIGKKIVRWWNMDYEEVNSYDEWKTWLTSSRMAPHLAYLKSEEVQKISTSIFVTNFPDHAKAKDLWNICKQYGQVVDAFIPDRKSKAEANSNNGSRTVKMSYVNVVNGDTKSTEACEPALLLDESCLNQLDYSLGLFVKVKELSSFDNMRMVLRNEGLNDIDLRYMGGMWIMIGFKTKDTKAKFQSCLGATSWFSQIIQASKEFVIDERITWVDIEGIPLKLWSESAFNRIAAKWGKRFSVRAKETTGWIPDFDEQEEDNSESEDEQSVGFIKEDFDGSDAEKEGDNNVSMVPDSVTEDANVQAEEKANDLDVNNSLDPFEIYPLLNKKINVEEKMDKSNGTKSNKIDIKRTGRSLLTVMEELIKVEKTMGYNMKGCIKKY
nr:RNA-directed DNA polymerase, eukaryota [Tanacetum cinerariifolium]